MHRDVARQQLLKSHLVTKIEPFIANVQSSSVKCLVLQRFCPRATVTDQSIKTTSIDFSDSLERMSQAFAAVLLQGVSHDSQNDITSHFWLRIVGHHRLDGLAAREKTRPPENLRGNHFLHGASH